MPVTIPYFERQQNLPTKYEGLTTGLTSGLKLGYGFGESMMKLPGQLKETELLNAIREYQKQKAQAEAPYYGEMARIGARQAELGLEKAEAEEPYYKQMAQAAAQIAAVKPAYMNAKAKDLLSQVEYRDMKAKYPGIDKGGIEGALAWSLWSSDHPKELAKISNALQKQGLTPNLADQMTGQSIAQPGQLEGQPTAQQQFAQPTAQTIAQQNAFTPPAREPTSRENASPLVGRNQQYDMATGRGQYQPPPEKLTTEQIPVAVESATKFATISNALQPVKLQPHPSQDQQVANSISTLDVHTTGIPGVYMERNGAMNPIGMLFGDAKSQQDYRQARIKNMEIQQKAMAYNGMPYTEKLYYTGQARALGFTGEEATHLGQQGNTLRDLVSIAKKKHPNDPQYQALDPNDETTWPLPRPAPTVAMYGQIERANVARAAINELDPIVTEWLGPYSTRILHYSPVAFFDMIKGLNKDQQAKAIAAAGWTYEKAILINKSGGVQNIGIEALRHTLDAGLDNFKFVETVSQDVWEKAKEYNRYIMNRLVRVENNAIYRGYDNWMRQEDMMSLPEPLSEGNAQDKVARIDAEIAKIQKELSK